MDHKTYFPDPCLYRIKFLHALSTLWGYANDQVRIPVSYLVRFPKSTNDHKVRGKHLFKDD